MNRLSLVKASLIFISRCKTRKECRVPLDRAGLGTADWQDEITHVIRSGRMNGQFLYQGDALRICIPQRRTGLLLTFAADLEWLLSTR